jgi:hypothetical protein
MPCLDLPYQLMVSHIPFLVNWVLAAPSLAIFEAITMLRAKHLLKVYLARVV